MILPTKHLSPGRAIISVSSEILELINSHSTVSSVWNDLQVKYKASLRKDKISYDWYVLSLDFLYLINAIDQRNGNLIRAVV